jgi:hypothetical protein
MVDHDPKNSHRPQPIDVASIADEIHLNLFLKLWELIEKRESNHSTRKALLCRLQEKMTGTTITTMDCPW